jgi:predicted AlkP superfamily pyrophosphatase or phosphodiesterase
MNKKLLIIQVAALGYDLLKQHHIENINGLNYKPFTTSFPAVTCTAQASFRTGLTAKNHGMVANGLYHRDLKKALFWEQSATLIHGPRIWDEFRKSGKRVAMLFWQQSLGENADMILSPAPIHKHHGGMILDCYSKPANLYHKTCQHVGKPFALRHYWGPFASSKAGQWITDATCFVISDPELSPELCLTYIPSLDYDLQRYGPKSKQAKKALHTTLQQIEQLQKCAEKKGYKILVFGDYAIGRSFSPVYPNRILAQNGLFEIRTVKNMQYPDLYTSPTFALVDHEIAHIYIKKPELKEATIKLFSTHPAIEQVIDPATNDSYDMGHSNTGELILIANPGYWFAYPWWQQSNNAPDYASHIDIHNKPGYDPCELFLGWPPGSISLNTQKIKGSHGRNDRPAAYASNIIHNTCETITDLANYLQEQFN